MTLSTDAYFVFAMIIATFWAAMYALNCAPEKKWRIRIALVIVVLCVSVGFPMLMRLIGYVPATMTP